MRSVFRRLLTGAVLSTQFASVPMSSSAPPPSQVSVTARAASEVRSSEAMPGASKAAERGGGVRDRGGGVRDKRQAWERASRRKQAKMGGNCETGRARMRRDFIILGGV